LNLLGLFMRVFAAFPGAKVIFKGPNFYTVKPKGPYEVL
jgi:hypothetical protein